MNKIYIFFVFSLSIISSIKSAALLGGEKIVNFNEKLFNEYLETQNYGGLNPIIKALIEIKNSKTLKLITHSMKTKNDPLCYYTSIRNIMLLEHSPKGALPPEIIEEVLKNMVLSLMLLAGDLACCIRISGDDSNICNARYTCLRTHYAHWYQVHLEKNVRDNDINIQQVLQPIHLWTKQQSIEQPSPFWVRYFTESHFYGVWLINFETPTKNERDSYNSNKKQFAAIRVASQKEFLAVLEKCPDWDSFFKLDFIRELNRQVLGGDKTEVIMVAATVDRKKV